MITNNGAATDPGQMSSRLPAHDSPVLLFRPIRAGSPGERSVFSDNRWDITPGLFEEHARGSSVPWHGYPDHWRRAAKHYIWMLINSDGAEPLPFSNTRRLSLRSIVSVASRLLILVHWFDAEGVTDLQQLDPRRLERLLNHVIDLDINPRQKAQLITEIHRLWAHRNVVEWPLKMPDPTPWDGENASSLVGRRPRASENLRYRISDSTLQPMLLWAFRFVQDFADDIIEAQLSWLAYDRNRPVRDRPMARGDNGTLRRRVEECINQFRDEGRPLPGRLIHGRLTLDLIHLANVIGCRGVSLERYKNVFLISGLPIERGAFAVRHPIGLIDGQSWVPDGIDYRHTAVLARHLAAACFIVISYLSGMRPGEVLNLARGCATTNPKTKISTIRGRHYKGVVETDGSHNPRGAVRADPWVVHPIVVQAIGVLERLHDHDVLFPASLMPGKMKQLEREGETRRRQQARSDVTMNRDIEAFAHWVRDYCRKNNREDIIPDDPRGPVTGSRFRRTLAWHIVRQPRGLVAAAIQYGHVHVSITQGYGGGSDSGFADEIAFEDWLLRIETVADLQHSLDEGGRVSGPASGELQRRVADADQRFAGRVHLTVRQAAKSLENPSLQIFKGRGMHCVMDSAKAACAVTPAGRSETMTPDLDGCMPHCQNMARTDGDIAELSEDAERLEEVARDPLAPFIRTSRERAEAARLRNVIANHQGE